MELVTITFIKTANIHERYLPIFLGLSSVLFYTEITYAIRVPFYAYVSGTSDHYYFLQIRFPSTCLHVHPIVTILNYSESLTKIFPTQILCFVASVVASVYTLFMEGELKT